MKDFGAEIAISVFDAGGDYHDAQKAFYAKQTEDLAEARKKLAAFESGENPGEFSNEPKKKKSLWDKS